MNTINSYIRRGYWAILSLILLACNDPGSSYDDSGTVARLAAPPSFMLLRPAESSKANTEIILTWQAVPGAETYEVQQRRDGAWTDIPNLQLNGNSVTVDALTAGSLYSFRVRAKSKVYSTYTEMQGRTLSDSATPLSGTPSGLKASAPKDVARQSTGVELSWAALTDAAVGGYEIQYATEDNAWDEANKVKSVKVKGAPGRDSKALSINDLKSETKYYFRIRAAGLPTDSAQAPGPWSASTAMLYPETWSELHSLVYPRITVENPNPDLTDIYTGKIREMYSLFSNSEFNGNISSWNTSRVTTMFGMFRNASAFNGDISAWDTSQVTNMREVFREASAFNGDISKWNTSSVTNMSTMFYRAKAFNGDISRWNTSEVTNMIAMFDTATVFNTDISSWKTSKVTTMNGMFANTAAFNQDISGWNTSSVEHMGAMFSYAEAFNRDISGWNTSKVVYMGSMFDHAKVFNQNISDWKTSEVTHMRYMFRGAAAFDQDLSGWDVPLVTDHTAAFTDSAMETEYCKWPILFRDGKNSCSGAYNTRKVQVPSGLRAKAPADVSAQLTGVDLSWTPLTGDGVAGYEIQYFTKDNAWDEAGVKVKAVSGRDSKALSINDLKSETKYYFRIRAAGLPTAQAPGPWSASTAMLYPETWSELHSLVRPRITVENPNPDLTDIYTGKIREMYSLFSNSEFNGNISSWNTSRVTTMFGMFRNAFAFNGDISAWDTSQVTNMREVFEEASAFNGDISKWNTSSVTNMSYMFHRAKAFNGDISRWNTSEVTNMQGMFNTATVFNTDISSWKTSKVTTMNGMFANTAAFNQDISGWNTSSVERMAAMFSYAEAFNRDISGWNTSKVVYMGSMFDHAKVFNQNISDWKTSEVTDMRYMFRGAAAFDQDLSGWDVPLVTDHTAAFTDSAMETEYCKWPILFRDGKNSCSGAYNTRKVQVPSGLRAKAPADVSAQLTGVDLSWTPLTGDGVAGYEIQYFTKDNAWDEAGVKVKAVSGRDSKALSINDLKSETKYYFRIRAAGLPTAQAPGPWSASTAMLYPETWSELHSLVRPRITVENPNPDLTDIYTGKIREMYSLFSNSEFNGNISSWNTSRVTTMFGMFRNAFAFNGDISAWDTSQVTNMREVFEEASAFNGDISKWNTSSVTNMSYMFHRAKAFNGDISRWNTSEVTNMQGMFDTATVFNTDISSWKTSKVTTMKFMFANTAAFNQDISGWNTSSVERMAAMFSYAEAFNRDISGWNTSKVVYMGSMFDHAKVFNQNISDWKTSEVTDMRYMFRGAAAFDQDLSGWDVPLVTDHTAAFTDSAMEGKTARQPSFR